MSQNQQAMTGASATDSIAADMPSVPGAESAKSIIENAVHPHDAGAAPTSTAATPATPASTAATSVATGSSRPAVAGASTRQPSGGTGASMDALFTDQVIDLSIMGETLTFAKRSVVTEEVRLYKRSLTANESITDTIRRERVTVEGADVVEGADSQLDAQGVQADQGNSGGGVQDTLQQSSQNVQQGATEAKHGLDGMIDSAVDRLFGGHQQQ